jgi:hypothetical protein
MADGTVTIDSKLDTSGAEKGVNGLKDKLEGAGKSIANAGKIAVTGVTAIVGAVAGATAGAFKLAERASNLSEAQNVVSETFKQSKGEILKWTEQVSATTGISQTNATKFVGSMGAMLKSSGLAEEDAGKMAKAMVQLTGDMSSFYNLDNDTAWEKIRSGIAGETEPLKQLGINMSVANLEAYGMANGMETAYAQMTQAEQTQLRYNYLLSVTADAQGDFGRTLETSFPNQLRVAQMQMETMAVSVGQKFLPAFLDAFKGINEGIKTGNFTMVGESIAKMINNVIKIFTDMAPQFISMGVGLFNGLIAGLTTAMPMMAQALVNLIQGLVKALTDSLPTLMPAIVMVITTLANGFLTLMPQIIELGLMVLNDFLFGIMRNLPLIIPVVQSAITQIVTSLTTYLPSILEAGLEILIALIKGIISALPAFVPMALQLITEVTTLLLNYLPVLIPVAIELILTLIRGIISALPTLIKMLPVIVTSVVNAIVDNLDLIIDATIELVLAIIDALLDNLPLLVDSAIKIVVALASGLIRAVPKLIVGVIELIGAVQKKFSETDWLKMGIDIIKGLIKGIASMNKEVGKVVGELVGGLVDGVKNFLGIKSPSRVFAGIGKFTVMGFEEGFDDRFTNAQRLVENSFKDLTGNLQGDISLNANTSSYGSFSGIANEKPIDVTLNSPLYLDGEKIADNQTRIADLRRLQYGG